MTWSLIAALLWLVAANVLALIPSRDNHWSRAYLLIALGIPLLGWLTYENGPWIGMAAFLAGSSLLRWPLIYLWRWVKGGLMDEMPPRRDTTLPPRSLLDSDRTIPPRA